MSEEIQEPRIYSVPEENYHPLLDDLKRLQRRAKKLDSEEIGITDLGLEDHQGYRARISGGGVSNKVKYLAPGTNPDEHFTMGYESTPLVRRYYRFTIKGTAPKLADWTFAGALDVVRDEDGKVVGNMLRAIPGMDLPLIYRDSKPHCDHCKIARGWKSTFVVKHADGTFKQVGRQCLKDFTGHADPEALARMAELLMELNALCDGSEDDYEEGMGGGGGTNHRFSVASLLDIAACIVRVDGWKPSSFDDSTRGTLGGYVFSEKDDFERYQRRYPISEADKAIGEKTMEWLQELGEQCDLNDYLHNLSMIGKAGSVDAKSFGLLASAIPAYLRVEEKLILARRESLTSNHVGEVGQKGLEMVLTLAARTYHESEFGTKALMKFVDDAGDIIIWWTTSAAADDMAIGARVKAKATVKKHNYFRQVKQTEVLRLKVLETLEAPPAPEAIATVPVGVCLASA
jgi:hypothetical protein